MSHVNELFQDLLNYKRNQSLEKSRFSVTLSDADIQRLDNLARHFDKKRSVLAHDILVASISELENAIHKASRSEE